LTIKKGGDILKQLKGFISCKNKLSDAQCLEILQNIALQGKT